jgi:hypothetical protein
MLKLNGFLMCYIDKRKPTGLKGTHLLKSKLNEVAKPLNKSENDKFSSYGYYISPEIIQKKFKRKPSITYYKSSILNTNSKKEEDKIVKLHLKEIKQLYFTHAINPGEFW